MHIFNYHVVYFKYLTILFVDYTSVEFRGEKIEIEWEGHKCRKGIEKYYSSHEPILI